MNTLVNDFPKKLEPWQHKTQCAKCNDIIYSRYSGEYVSCKCGAISVNTTPHYSFLIGEAQDFKTPDE